MGEDQALHVRFAICMKFSRIIKYSAFILFVVFLSFVLYLRPAYFRNVEKERQARVLYLQKESQWQILSSKLRSRINRFSGISGVIVKDLEFGFEFRHNEDKLFPSASLAKIPIMAAVYKAADEGKLDLGREVVLMDRDKLSGSGTLKTMPAGSCFTVDELVNLMVSTSDNTATNMITNVLGMDYINGSILGFGLDASCLSRRVADYDARDRGLENYTTARDMAFMLEEIYRGKLISEKASRKGLDVLLKQKSRNRIPKYLPEDVPVAHKTGLEKGICHDVGIIFDARGDFLICILTKHSNSNSIPSKNFIADISRLVYQRHDQPVFTLKNEESASSTVLPKKLTVKEIQTFMKNKDLYWGAIDGTVGPGTRWAIKEFQKISDLTPDGIVGAKTTAAMFECSATAGKDMFGDNGKIR